MTAMPDDRTEPVDTGDPWLADPGEDDDRRREQDRPDLYQEWRRND